MRRTNFILARHVFLLCCLAFSAGCGGNAPSKTDKKEGADTTEPVLVLPGNPTKSSQQTIQFLGSQGTGRRFCIIADCSLSLSPGSFEIIKKEVGKTLESLDEYSEFHLMFFAGKPYPMPGGDWLKGKEAVAGVQPWIDRLPRVGGTVAVPPFERAFKLTPPPDVIFFMTDGKIPASDPAAIAALNKSEPKVVVHTILFTRTPDLVAPEDASRARLERIAHDAGGTFKQFVDPDGLPAKKKKKAK